MTIDRPRTHKIRGGYCSDPYTNEVITRHREEITSLRAQGMSWTKTAAALDITVETVKARLKRADEMDARGGAERKSATSMLSGLSTSN